MRNQRANNPNCLCLAPVLGLVVALAGGAGCKAAPLGRPMNLGAPNTGPGSVEYARRQLQGTWTLERLEIADASGTLRPINATATLTYDEFGNMKVSGRVLDVLPDDQRRALLPLVEYSGRAIIDPAKNEIRVENVEQRAEVDPALNSAVGTERIRKYEVTDTTLVIRFLTADGRTTAATRFKR